MNSWTITKSLVCLGPCRRATLLPCVVPAGGDSQQAALSGYWIGLVALTNSYPLMGSSRPPVRTRPWLLSISRSSLSWRFSRRSRRNSSRSCVVSPSSRRPSFGLLYPCVDALRTSNSRANSVGLRPARTSSTIRGGTPGDIVALWTPPYLTGVHQIGSTPTCHCRYGRSIRTPPARAQFRDQAGTCANFPSSSLSRSRTISSANLSAMLFLSLGYWPGREGPDSALGRIRAIIAYPKTP